MNPKPETGGFWVISRLSKNEKGSIFFVRGGFYLLTAGGLIRVSYFPWVEANTRLSIEWRVDRSTFGLVLIGVQFPFCISGILD
jgi:hypothetical protein